MRLLHFPASLRTRLLLLVFLAIIPAFALLVRQSVEQYEQAQLSLKREALAIAYQIAASPRETVPEPRQFLAHLAQVPEILRSGDACNNFVASVLKSSPYFSIINVMWPDGKPFCSTRPLDGSVDLSDRLYFKRVIESRSYAIGEYVVGRRSGKPAITFAWPILDTGKEVKAVISLSLGVQRTRLKQINALLDAGFRQHDGIVITAVIFNKSAVSALA